MPTRTSPRAPFWAARAARRSSAVVIVERPRIAAHVPEVRVNLARALGLDAASVSVKGKTNEGVGEVGRGEAIACHAVALVVEP